MYKLELDIEEIWTLQQALKCWLVALEVQKQEIRTVPQSTLDRLSGEVTREEDLDKTVDLTNELAVTYAEAAVLFERFVELIGEDITKS